MGIVESVQLRHNVVNLDICFVERSRRACRHAFMTCELFFFFYPPGGWGKIKL